MSRSWRASSLAHPRHKMPTIPSTDRGWVHLMSEMVNPPAVLPARRCHHIGFQNVKISYFLSHLHSFDTQACPLHRPLSLEKNLEGKSVQVCQSFDCVAVYATGQSCHNYVCNQTMNIVFS